MTYGIDTDFLVAVEIRDHVHHDAADQLLGRLLNQRDDLAVAPQTLADFVHVVTDPRRLKEPLTMSEAIDRAEHWWQAEEVIRLLPDERGVADWLHLLRQHRLGRQRLLDTMLAAVCISNGITKLITNNGSDYSAFDGLEIISYI